jgi:hypothetical protein
MNYAPIALFVYNRPEHTRQMIENLMKCSEFMESAVYVFSDAAKKTEDEDRVLETRRVVNSLLGDKAKIVAAEQNQGLAKSIISAINSLLEEFDRIIVLEDDLLVSTHFLSYMNNALETYQDESSVMQVSGYMFPVKELAHQTDIIFLPFIVSWGWGTWRRAWQYFDPDATGWEILKTDRAMRAKFNLDRSYYYFEILKAQMSGNANSWAIRWYWSVFKNNGYVVYPPISHIDNIGIDGSGTHGWMTGEQFKQLPDKQLTNPETFPASIQINAKNFELIQLAIRGGHSKLHVSLLAKVRTIRWSMKALAKHYTAKLKY